MSLKLVAKLMKRGAVAVYPTETAYAIGCDATNKKALKRIYKIKGREKNKPLTAIVCDLRMAKKYGKINKTAEKLIKKFMPGPLTLIVRKKKIIPKEFNRKNFGFRISSSKTARGMSCLLGKPIVATSANKSGKPAEYSAKKLIKLFGKNVDIIIDSGKIPRRKVSTIVDLTSGKIKVIREGALSQKRILSVSGK